MRKNAVGGRDAAEAEMTMGGEEDNCVAPLARVPLGCYRVDDTPIAVPASD